MMNKPRLLQMDPRDAMATPIMCYTMLDAETINELRSSVNCWQHLATVDVLWQRCF